MRASLFVSAYAAPGRTVGCHWDVGQDVGDGGEWHAGIRVPFAPRPQWHVWVYSPSHLLGRGSHAEGSEEGC